MLVVLFRRYDLTFTTMLVADKGGNVALTQPAGATVAGSGLTQPCAVKSRWPALAVALKYVVFFAATLPVALKVPAAVVCGDATLVSLDADGPRTMVT
ncbi:MAG TPA: hypothetical protein VF327_11235, partial [Gaiellaceae bacterium]